MHVTVTKVSTSSFETSSGDAGLKKRTKFSVRTGVEAVCVTLALVRTSVLRPSQSAQLSEAIIFFRFQNRNACAARWRLSPAAHTGRPCDNTMRPATSADTESVSPTSSLQYLAHLWMGHW